MVQQAKSQQGKDRYNRVRVKIAGDVYDLRSEASVPYIQKVAALVDQRMSQMVKAFPTVSRHRLAVMVALNLADELLRAKGVLVEEVAAAGEDVPKDTSGEAAGDGGNLF